MSGSATVDIKVFGYDMDVTNAVANDLKEKLGGLKGTRDVQLSRDDLRPELQRGLRPRPPCRITA